MKYYKTIQTTTEQLEKTICDKCGCEVDVGQFRVNEIDFTYLVGDSYPEGTFADSYALDLCEPCAIKMLSLLKENGYKVRKLDSWD